MRSSMSVFAALGMVLSAVAAEPTAPCTGGEITVIDNGDSYDFIHSFKTVDEVSTFSNLADRDIALRYLVVGGGGAGGDSRAAVPTGSYGGGAGGGGGGGVVGANAVIPPGESWKVLVGDGGHSPNSYTQDGRLAKGSSISNGTVCIAYAPGGGHGCSCANHATAGELIKKGAAGGGGQARVTVATTYNGSGTFASSYFGTTYKMNSGAESTYGATNAVSSAKVYIFAGGGGGAAKAGHGGDTATYASGRGGEGIVSDLSGEEIEYGAGGGGGGTIVYRTLLAELGFPNGVLGGAGANDGGVGAHYTTTTEAADTFVFALPGTPNTGCGGGGGCSGGKTKSGTSTSPGADGGTGVVIIRYTVVKEQTLDALTGAAGAKGTVTFACSSEGPFTYGQDGRISGLKAGATVSLSAVSDDASDVLTGWRDNATGEVFSGAELTLTATEDGTTYTAAFGRVWTWNRQEKTISDGDWTFRAFPYTADGDNNAVTVSTNLLSGTSTVNFMTGVKDTDGVDCVIATIGTYNSDGHHAAFYANAAARSALVDLFLPESGLSYIGTSAIRACVNLNSICIPDGVRICKRAFNSNKGMRKLFFKGGSEGSQVLYVGNGEEFDMCTGLTGRIVLPKGVKRINTGSFYGCSGVTEFVLGSQTISIAENGFSGCSSLAKIEFPTTVTTLGANAFYGCSSLSGRISLANVKDVPSRAFYNTRLESVELSAATNVSYQAFYGAPVTNVVFGAERVSFWNDPTADHATVTAKDYCEVFSHAVENCDFYFPGKAPQLPAFEPGAFGNKAVFGSLPVRLHGRFCKDRSAWEALVADVGTTDATGAPDCGYANIPKGRLFSRLGEDETVGHWLYDWAPSGSWGMYLFLR